MNLLVMTVGSCYGLGGIWSTPYFYLAMLPSTSFCKLGLRFPHKSWELGYLCDYMKLDIPVKKEIHKCHSNHEKPFTLIHRLCNHRKQGWKSLQKVVYSILCPYSIIQSHKLKGVFGQSVLYSIQQLPSIPSNLFSCSTWLRNFFLMSNLKPP